MTKIKSSPDIAVLILRLAIGISYLSFVSLAIANFQYQPIAVVSLLISILGSILLILGLFTRLVVVIFFLFTFFTLLAYGQIESLQSLINLILGIKIWLFVVIWLIGPGKYSLDNKLFNKTVL